MNFPEDMNLPPEDAHAPIAERWESLRQLDRDDVPKEWIERDSPSGLLRYTHYPSGKTLLQQPYYRYERKLTQWRADRDAFFRAYPPTMLILTPSKKYVGTTVDAVGFDGYER